MKKHPSGKPVNKPQRRDWRDGYENLSEPRVARLRQSKAISAIGFTAHLTQEFEEDET